MPSFSGTNVLQNQRFRLPQETHTVPNRTPHHSSVKSNCISICPGRTATPPCFRTISVMMVNIITGENPDRNLLNTAVEAQQLRTKPDDALKISRCCETQRGKQNALTRLATLWRLLEREAQKKKLPNRQKIDREIPRQQSYGQRSGNPLAVSVQALPRQIRLGNNFSQRRSSTRLAAELSTAANALKGPGVTAAGLGCCRSISRQAACTSCEA
jgi:hypothetical protein